MTFDPHFNFSLAPLKQCEFKLYEDIKYTLTGTIDNPDFANLVKHYFLRILAYKLQMMLSQGKKINKIITGNLSDEELVDAQLFLDRPWLDFLEIAEERINYKGSNEARNFDMPRQLPEEQRNSAKVLQPTSVLDHHANMESAKQVQYGSINDHEDRISK